MVNIGMTSRDVARELARRYSTMTHEELDLLEGILVPMKFPKGEKVISEGEVCTHIGWSRALCANITIRTIRS